TTASFSTPILAAGPHTLSASFSGDSNFNPSTAPALSQTVSKASTGTQLVSSVSPSLAGQALTLTATVTVSIAGTPTGVVVFSDGATSLGQGTLTTSGGSTTASFSTSSLTVGSHTITASYAGDSNFQSSSGTLA